MKLKTEKQRKKSIKPKAQFLGEKKKINKIDKSLARLTKNKRERKKLSATEDWGHQ